jgi:hypothetical protein
MYQSSDFDIGGDRLRIKREQYPLAKIVNIKARQSSLTKQLLRAAGIGLIFSFAVWLLPLFNTAPEVTTILAPLLFIAGMLFALLQYARYELLIEVRHGDETGIQWVTVARSRRQQDFALFRQQADILTRRLMR